MENTFLVSKYLKDNKIYPKVEEKYGTKIELLDTGELLIKGDAESLIDLADLLVSLAESNNSEGNHFHIGKESIIDEDSKIAEVIIERK